LYYELYGNHSYNTGNVTKIEDISKVTLKIYTPTGNNLFTSITPDGCIIFTHKCSSNFIFHLPFDDIIINHHSLILSNVSKDYYEFFNSSNVISLLLNVN
jgi:hypothetical protein